MLTKIIENIDIDESINSSDYSNVAMLVDNPDFLKAIKMARKGLGLSKLVNCEDIVNWIDYLDQKLSTLNATHRLNMKILSIKNQFSKGIAFTNVIKSAILTGKVSPKDLQNSAICLEYPFPEELREFKSEEPLVAILVSPDTKFKEVKRLMKTEVKDIFNNKEYKVVKVRTSSNIVRDRRWYWLHEHGKSYQEIANTNKDFKYNRDTVIKAIKQYEEKLGV
jgi:hypothetical protein